MVYVAIGVMGFVAGFLFDLVSLRDIRIVKPALWLIQCGLFAYAMVMLCLRSERIAVPLWLTYLGWVALCLAAFLLLYSLFINLPFRKTYVAAGAEHKLVKTGTYALVRHPGVLWFGFALVGLILVSQSRLLLLSSPLWISLDVLWVMLQERFVLCKILEGYDAYQRETPMLIPNRRSVGAFVSSLRQQRKEESNAGGP